MSGSRETGSGVSIRTILLLLFSFHFCSLELEFQPLKLKSSLLLLEFRIGLLDHEQALHQFWFGHLQIPRPSSIGIPPWVDAQGMSLYRRLCVLASFAYPFAALSGTIGRTVLSVIGMSLLVFQHR